MVRGCMVNLREHGTYDITSDPILMIIHCIMEV